MEKAWSLALWCVLVCYNTGYRVGKLPGLPSRQKGIMSMARYHYTREKRMAKGQMLCADGKPVMFGETLYGGDGRDWLIVGIAGAWSYDVYGLHVAHDGKKEKKPLRAE